MLIINANREILFMGAIKIVNVSMFINTQICCHFVYLHKSLVTLAINIDS